VFTVAQSGKDDIAGPGLKDKSLSVVAAESGFLDLAVEQFGQFRMAAEQRLFVLNKNNQRFTGRSAG